MTREFTLSARITLDGVELTVRANSEDEARQKIAGGQWDEEDRGPAEMVDWAAGRLLAEEELDGSMRKGMRGFRGGKP